MQTLKKKDILKYKTKINEGGEDFSELTGVDEEFKSKAQQGYFYAQANDDSKSDEEKAKWKKWAKEYSDETDFEDLPDKVEEEQELEELVNNVGAPIDGGEKPTTSQIKTAPQATTDEFNTVAIQPNRYLYNVNSVGPRVMGVTAEQENKIAKEKAIALLENLDNDYNDNAIIDLKELPDGVVRKTLDLVKSVKLNGLSDDKNKKDMILNYINNEFNSNA